MDPAQCFRRARLVHTDSPKKRRSISPWGLFEVMVP
jgi:hypothetical protein